MANLIRSKKTCLIIGKIKTATGIKCMNHIIIYFRFIYEEIKKKCENL